MSIWKNIANIHTPANIDTPENLWFLAISYFAWCEENPHISSQVVKYPLHYELACIPQMRAFTMRSFLAHAGLTKAAYEAAKAKPEFEVVCELIESIIYDQKFTGAAAGVLKESLISRDLGLGEKVDHTSSDGSMTPSHVDESVVKSLADKLCGD